MAPSADVGELDLRALLGVLRRRKRTIGLVVLLVVASTLATSLLQEPLYEGEVQVLLQPSSTESIFDPSEDRPDAERNVGTEIEVVKSQPVQAAVEARLGSVAEVEAAPVGDTDLIRIAVESTDQEQAAAAAREYALAYIDFRRQQAVDDIDQASQKIASKIDDLQARISALDEQAARSAEQGVSAESAIASRDLLVTQQALFKQRLDELQVEAELKTGGAQLITRGNVPTSTVRPKPVRSGIVALIAGAILGVALALIREYLDDSVRTKEELDRLTTGIPVLGVIPFIEGLEAPGTPQVLSLAQPDSLASEAYRALRTSLQFLAVERAPRVIQVTSSVAGEGKTSTVANLAVVLANAGQRVLAIDCDLRRPSLHRLFRLLSEVGFTSAVLGQSTLSAAIEAVPAVYNLELLSSGPFAPNPSELLSSKKTAALLAPLRADYDVILIDSPPVLPVADATALSAWVDATLLVVAAGSTTRKDLQETVELLRQVEAPLVGTVLNQAAGQVGYRYRYESDHSRYPRTEASPGATVGRPAGPPESGTAEQVERAGSSAERFDKILRPETPFDASSETSRASTASSNEVKENGRKHTRYEPTEAAGDSKGADRPSSSAKSE